MKSMIKEILKEWNLNDCPNQIYHSSWSVKETSICIKYFAKQGYRFLRFVHCQMEELILI